MSISQRLLRELRARCSNRADAQGTIDNLSKKPLHIRLSELEASRIDWSQFLRTGTVSLAPKKELRRHQRDALRAVTEGLVDADRGKMIMACGTGKTFTALRIAETMAGPGKRVLLVVPSLALMSQTVSMETMKIVNRLPTLEID